MARSVSFDPVADRYDETRGGDRRGDAIAGLLDPHLPADGPLFEIGIGTGVVAAALGRLGRTVLGVDLSPNMARRARGRLGARLTLGDACHLPVRPGSLGGAYMVWVLHLVADPARVVAEAARVLAPGGVLAAVPAVPAGDESDPMIAAQRPLHELRTARPGPAETEAWMAAAGLEPIGRHVAEDTSEGSPSQAAHEIEQRVWSMLWDVDDERWQGVVVPVIEALRALPDPDAPRTIVHRTQLVVARRPVGPAPR